MVRRHNRLLVAFYVIGDALLAAWAFLLAYIIRFDFGLIRVSYGTPPLIDDVQMRRWVEVCTDEYRSLRAGHGDSLLNDYGATNPGEFFAVAAEVFFDRPVEMAELKPDLYGVFRDYFAQDPAARRPR